MAGGIFFAESETLSHFQNQISDSTPGLTVLSRRFDSESLKISALIEKIFSQNYNYPAKIFKRRYADEKNFLHSQLIPINRDSFLFFSR